MASTKLLLSYTNSTGSATTASAVSTTNSYSLVFDATRKSIWTQGAEYGYAGNVKSISAGSGSADTGKYVSKVEVSNSNGAYTITATYASLPTESSLTVSNTSGTSSRGFVYGMTVSGHAITYQYQAFSAPTGTSGTAVTIGSTGVITGLSVDANTGKISYTYGSITSNNTNTTNVTIASSGTGNYVSAVTMTNTGNNANEHALTITYSTLPTLSLTKETGSTTLTHGGTFTYDIVKSVSNHGLTYTRVTATMPSETTLSVSGATGTNAKYINGITVSDHAISYTYANIPTLSGGAAASSGKYVSGVTVSGHAVTVTQESLPTIGNGTFYVYVGRSVSVAEAKTLGTANQTTNSVAYITAEDLGVTGVMNFLGTVTTAPTTSSVNINGSSTATTAVKGDVVVNTSTNKEYLHSGAASGNPWVELGDETSFALKSTTVSNSSTTDGITATLGGTVNAPTITLTGTATQKNNKTSGNSGTEAKNSESATTTKIDSTNSRVITNVTLTGTGLTYTYASLPAYAFNDTTDNQTSGNSGTTAVNSGAATGTKIASSGPRVITNVTLTATGLTYTYADLPANAFNDDKVKVNTVSYGDKLYLTGQPADINLFGTAQNDWYNSNVYTTAGVVYATSGSVASNSGALVTGGAVYSTVTGTSMLGKSVSSSSSTDGITATLGGTVLSPTISLSGTATQKNNQTSGNSGTNAYNTTAHAAGAATTIPSGYARVITNVTLTETGLTYTYASLPAAAFSTGTDTKSTVTLDSTAGTGVVTGASLTNNGTNATDHKLTLSYTSLAVTSGTAATYSNSATAMASTNAQVLTNISQAANGKISYTYSKLPATAFTDEKVKDVAAATKAYLLGHAATGTTATATSNTAVYMTGGYVYATSGSVASGITTLVTGGTVYNVVNGSISYTSAASDGVKVHLSGKVNAPQTEVVVTPADFWGTL